MSTKKGSHTVILATFLLSCVVHISTSDSKGTCERGWFGSQCTYRCRCQGNMCDTEGRCREGYTCEPGWFGPACQYYDLGRSANVTPGYMTVVTDSSEVTCNDYRYVQTVTLNWTISYPFQWLRVHVDNADVLEKFQFQLKNNSKPVSCGFVYLTRIDSQTLDIHCHTPVLVNTVILKGAGVGDLCSLYISGGRNLALRQLVRQSSTSVDVYSNIDFDKTKPDNAVDGDPSGFFEKRSCTHTKREANPFWFLLFASAKIVNRYMIYNREDSHQHRIRGFRLQALDDSGDQVFWYSDNGNSTRSTYQVVDNNAERRVKSVRISLSKSEVLTLCEVELYGESVCPSGHYGRDCEHTCNCDVTSDSCFVSTGGCPSGCPTGFYGEGCRQSDAVISWRTLGFGLGITLAVLVVAVVFCLCCAWRKRRANRTIGSAAVDSDTKPARPHRLQMKTCTYDTTEDEGYEMPSYLVPLP